MRAGRWSAKVFPEFGMNLADLRFAGRPILRAPMDLDVLRNDRYLYGVPLLLPANRTKGGEFPFQGRRCALPLTEPERGNNLHGQMTDAPFRLTAREEGKVRGEYGNRGERYPFAFDLAIEDRLSEDGWDRAVELTALEDMPFTLAFHATFVEPRAFHVPVGRRFLCDRNYIPTGETVPAEPFGKVISGFYEAAGRTARVDGFAFTVSDGFDQWVLYNGDGEQGFLCVEPQCGGVNGLNTALHRTLRSGETARFSLAIRREE